MTNSEYEEDIELEVDYLDEELTTLTKNGPPTTTMRKAVETIENIIGSEDTIHVAAAAGSFVEAFTKQPKKQKEKLPMSGAEYKQLTIDSFKKTRKGMTTPEFTDPAALGELERTHLKVVEKEVNDLFYSIYGYKISEVLNYMAGKGLISKTVHNLGINQLLFLKNLAIYSIESGEYELARALNRFKTYANINYEESLVL